MTPNIPGLIGGADAFGIWDAFQASDLLEFSNAPSNAKGGLLLLDENWNTVRPESFRLFNARHPGLYTEFPGYDLLLFANLLSVDQFGELGVGKNGYLFSLAQRGFLNDLRDGSLDGIGPVQLVDLHPGQVFATLVRDDATIFNAFIEKADFAYFNIPLVPEQASYLTPEPSSSTLLITGLIPLGLAWRRKRGQ
jgi:hypothetical protein